MARINSQYPALSGGMSQRHERALRTNQLREQRNMVFDAVVGLTRRPGTTALHSRAGSVASPANHREFQFQIGDEDFCLHYRTAGPAVGTDGVVVVNDTTGTILAAPTTQGGNPMVTTVLENGASAVAAVGDLVVLAPATEEPTASVTYPWAAASNQRQHVVWVRGGAYSRTFALRLLRGNQKLVIEYTTLEASYPKVLDTSDLLPTDPDYSKKVNDRTNAYNSEATAWIAAALADAAPENIADKLADALRDSSFLDPAATVTVQGPYIYIDDVSIDEVETDDGGDGNLMRGVGNVVGSPELLTASAQPGKIVKVRPGNSETGDVFYLRAVAKDGGSDFTNVTWEEAAGEITTPGHLFAYLTVVGGVAFLGGTVSWINAQTGRNFPEPAASASGDTTSNPAPAFFGERVTALAVYQDRLIVCRKDGYVAASRPGDYFNFFRDSAVTVIPSDPVTFFIIGGDGDTVRHAITYSESLLLVGDERQYAIPASVTIAPGTAGATPFSETPGMATVRPDVISESVYFARFHNGYGSLHTMRPGRTVKTPYVAEVTENVQTLIDAQPLTVVPMVTPEIILLRTAGARMIVADYRHTEGGEAYAPHYWDFPGSGSLVGLWQYRGEVRMLWDGGAGTLYLDRLRLQQTADGVTTTHLDRGSMEYVSRVDLVSPRLSPEAGNITGTGIGSQGFGNQQMVVSTMDLYFADTGGATITVTGRAPETVYAKET